MRYVGYYWTQAEFLEAIDRWDPFQDEDHIPLGEVVWAHILW